MRKMKIMGFVLTLIVLVSFCEVYEYKENKAIEICQKAKVQLQMDNIWEQLGLQLYGLNSDATWLDFANMLAKQNPNKKQDWSAITIDAKDLYMVSFADEEGWGHRWEVAIDQNIVKHVNSNEYLTRKYGLSRLGNSEDFKIVLTEKDTLRYYRRYRNSEPTIIYEYKGTIKNNTNKVIIDSEISGNLKLIFEEKTISESSGYNDGFIKVISKSSPWKPGEERTFRLKTGGIEALYTFYDPPYAFFEIQLKANDPVGYSFNENIIEIDLVDKWKNLRDKE